MSTLIETTALYTTQGGVARYVRGLLQGLRQADAGFDWEELGWPVENFGYAQPTRALKTLLREWGWAKVVAARAARRAGLVHHTALPIIPFVRGPRHVVTLHDLALVRHPERYRPWQRSAGLRRLRRVASADKVIAVSRFTADEAMAVLGLPSARLEVIHEGGLLDPAAEAGPLPTGLPEEFLLFVGALEPGKNLALLREIYATAPRPLPPLVIAGARWAGVSGEGSPPANWRYLGHVSDPELWALYDRARALVFPSRYEGFGLPVLEAMSRGCPVVCGPLPSLREIGGDAVATAELTVPAFGAALARLLADDAWREQLRAGGRARANAFSWTKCARQTLAVYRSVT